MRIFLTLHPTGNISVPGSMTWYKNIYEPLVDLGHDVFFFRIDEYLIETKQKFRSPGYKKNYENRLIQVFEQQNSIKPFDLFLAYLTDLDIDPEYLEKIKKSGVLSANFSCNNTHQFYLVEKISRYFDINLYAEKAAGDKFKCINANGIWFQMAANPKYYFPMNINKQHDISFIGMNYSKRAQYIYYLLENGLRVSCFGPNWLAPDYSKRIKTEIKRYKYLLSALTAFTAEQRLNYSSRIMMLDFNVLLRKKYKAFLNRPVSDNDMVKIYNQSKVNLGFSEVFSGDDNPSTMLQHHLHLREFEVPMSGGLYLINYSDELAEHYEPDKEVVVFRNEHELLHKAIYYLNHEDEAEKIRKAGLKRSLACHTYQQRFRDLFKQLNLH